MVEDDPNVSTVLTARLENLHYQVCGTAETGFAAVVTDLRLPAGSGFDIHTQGITAVHHRRGMGDIARHGPVASIPGRIGIQDRLEERIR